MFDTINSEIWGPYCWKFLHYLSLAYPNNPTHDDKQNIRDFIYSFANIIPCEKCKDHFNENLIKYPLTNKVLKNKYNFVNWLKDMHNDVNVMNDKKIYSYDDIIKEYDLTKKTTFEKYVKNKNTVNLSSIILIIGVICIYCYLRKI